MKDASFVKYVEDQLFALPNIISKRMFSGWGLYSDGRFFGIVSNGALYFKTNEKTRLKYMDHGSGCFRPSQKQVLKNYYEVPSEVLENSEKLSEWAMEAAEL